MAIPSGTRLGPYEIVSAIGEGGMGEVYKARDTRLDRIVALKALPAQVAAAPEFRERFEREARAISQLNHPNICTLFDVGEQAPSTGSGQAVSFLVMELLEGETLAARIAKGPIPVDQALKWAIQIAGALDAAHRRGILHRDLKPGNVMLTPAGVKLLDFGLAKMTGTTAAAGPAGASMTAPPTMTTPLTAQGTILGTFQYMAPEMVEGEEADARADIWAFGCVLYEMLTGRRPFVGKSQASLFGAIMKEDAPSVSLAQPLVPPALDRIVRTCLAKDPNQRVQSAHDLLLNLQWVAEGGSAAGTPAPVLARRKSRERLVWTAAALATGIAAAAAAWIVKPAPPQAGIVTRFVHTLDAKQQFTRAGRHTIAMAPDGTFFVFVANQQLFVRRMNEIAAQPIKGSEEDPLDPVVSPDGQWVAYFVQVTAGAQTPAGGGAARGSGRSGAGAAGAQPPNAGTAATTPSATLKKIPVTGGASIVLASLSFPYGVSWRGDTLVIGQGPAGVVSVPAGGGTPKELVKLQGEELLAASPQMIDSAGTLLFSLLMKNQRDWNSGDIVVQPAAGGERRVVVKGGHDGRVLPTGQLVYVREATLFGAPFDLKRAERSGDAVPLIVGVTSVPGTSGPGQFGISVDGRLAYVPGAAQAGVIRRTLEWVDRQGREQPIPAEPREYIYPRVSPSGKKVALDALDDHRDIWIWDLEHDILSRLTLEGDTTEKRGPIWSTDSQSLFYSSTEGNRGVLLRRSADGTGASEKLGEQTTANMMPTSVAPDGQQLVISLQQPDYNIALLPLSGDHKPTPLAATPKQETNGEVSPNGKWIAYESDESGRPEIYVRPFPAVDTGRWQISTAGGVRAAWARNGRELFYTSADEKMMSVPVSADAGKEFTYGRPVALFALQPFFMGRTSGRSSLIGRTYDVAADGRFILIKEPAGTAGDAQTIVVVEHWIDEVRKRLGK